MKITAGFQPQAMCQGEQPSIVTQKWACLTVILLSNENFSRAIPNFWTTTVTSALGA